VTLPAILLRFLPVSDSTLALVVLCLVFLAAVVAALLLALGFEARSKLAAMHHEQRKAARRVEERLSTDRACVLRDVTDGKKKEESS
jgi:type II secretory pathway component PulK